MKFSPLFDNAITDVIVHAAAFSLRFAAERHRQASADLQTGEPGQFFAKGHGTISTSESIAAQAKAEKLEIIAAQLAEKGPAPGGAREPPQVAVDAGAKVIKRHAEAGRSDDFRPLALEVWNAMWKATQEEFLRDVLR